MKLTDKQAMVLFDIAKWSLCIVGGVAGYPNEFLRNLVSEIANQQSDELKELGDKA